MNSKSEKDKGKEERRERRRGEKGGRKEEGGSETVRRGFCGPSSPVLVVFGQD